ncbi:MAG: transcription termination factor Rho [Firmicutes bacterium]|nr:transcription termination factor Rho [Bacillota bacterium]
MELDLLREKKVAELREIGKALKIPGAAAMKKKELLDILIKMAEEAEAKERDRERAEEEKKQAEAGNAPAGKPEEKTEKPAPKKRGRKPKADKAAGDSAEKPEEKDRKAVSEPENSAAKAEKPAEKQEKAGPKPEEEAGKPEQAEPAPAPKKRGRPAKKKAQAAPEKTSEKAEETASPKVKEPLIVEIVKTGEPDPVPAAVPAAEEAAEKPREEKPEERKDEKAKRTYELKDGRFETKGILEVTEQGYGFLRFENFMTSDEDIYVSQIQIRRFNLKTGDMIECIARPAAEGDRFGALLFVKTVNGDEPGKAIRRKDFSELTPIYPDRRIVLEKGSAALSMRMTDLVAPIGFGQRGLIVAPPKAGKTTILKQIAQSIEKQGLDAELIVLLIDERPEEVTDMKRSINGEVIYSTFDEQPQHHVKVAEMVLARAMRLAEHGKDVIILLDSITRLSRAYNLVEPPSGRTLSGGLDPAALYKPKKFFGAARNMEEGGSITILATALIETGSRMDDMIFEEFKGTGNMGIHLDRKLSEKRIFPAINLNKSGTRREDMLMSPDELEAVWMMRRAVADMGIQDATEKIVFELVHTRKNADFIERFKKIRL